MPNFLFEAPWDVARFPIGEHVPPWTYTPVFQYVMSNISGFQWQVSVILNSWLQLHHRWLIIVIADVLMPPELSRGEGMVESCRRQTGQQHRQNLDHPPPYHSMSNRTLSFYPSWTLPVTVLLKRSSGHGYAVLCVCAAR